MKKTVEMFSFVRLALSRDNEIKVLSNVALGHVKIDNIPPFSVENEIRTLDAVRASALRCLSGFDTSSAEDEKLLKTEELPFNIRNAILMRRGEKIVCHYFIDLADTMIPVLERRSDPKDVLRKLKKKKRAVGLTHEPYLTHIIIPLLEKGFVKANIVQKSS